MAAFVNRSPTTLLETPPRSSQNVPGDLPLSSPLQVFVKAKKKINDIYLDIESYVKETLGFVTDIPLGKEIVTDEETKEISSHEEKVRGIREVLARDHMKVAFFGRTSNGKSTVINAMLHDKILPSGIGHTTNCFLVVEGSEDGDAYLKTKDSTEKKNVQSVGQLAHALCNEKLDENSLVHVFWPKVKCPLLRDDVVFVDSPGIDVSPNLDEWIDMHCLDADVFVLVANAESTLMVTEKKFFHKVSTRLSKPNIFILNNRWDASASEPEFLEQMEQVRSQHLDRTMDFLVKELKVATKEQASERIFFVSAKEALQARLQEQKGFSPQSGAMAEGFSNRYFEFQDFERKFEECISKSAVKTKFEQHSQRGKTISNDIFIVMTSVVDKIQVQKYAKSLIRKELLDKLDFTDKQLDLLTHEIKDKICRMVDEVNNKVSNALSEEIRRIATLVEEFSMPFHSDSLVLNVYKKELHGYVEGGLGSNLRSRLSTSLAMNIESSQNEMTERMSALLPADKKHVSFNIIPRKEPFEVLYRLNCDNLCSDFKENIEFNFSLGMQALFSKFVRNGALNFMTGNKTAVIENVPQPESDSTIAPVSEQAVVTATEWAVISRMVLAGVASQGTMGGLLIAGFLFKTVGWRVLVVTGSIYGSLYLYERLTWTNKAKERAFKKQYVDYITTKLRMIVDLTSANCSHQVQQELSSTMARLSYLVDEARNEMEDSIQDLENQITYLEETSVAAKVLQNKASYVVHELDAFDENYINLKEEIRSTNSSPRL